MATREQKIEQHLKSLSKEEIFNEICRMISDWDLYTLIEYAQDSVIGNLENLSDQELRDEFYEWNYNSYANDEAFDDVEDPPTVSAVCCCDLHQVYRGEGHNLDCPERR